MSVVVADAFSAAVGEDGSLFVWHRRDSSEPVPARVSALPGPVVQIASGGKHTGVVTDAGQLLMCGVGGWGQLGLGDETDRTTLTLLDQALFDDDAVLMVACGGYHTAALTEGGRVYTFGWGGNGRLGHVSEESQRAPRRVPAARFNNQRVAMLAAGNMHTVALSVEGHVYTWGFGSHGRLGHDDTEDLWAPRLVEPGLFGGEKVVFVAAGGDHTVAVTTGGRLYTWGQGWHGQLGHGDTGNRLVPTLVGPGAFGGSAVVMAACGSFHTLVVTHDGALWACGRGFNGLLGLSDDGVRHAFERVGAGEFGGARVVAAASGEHHLAAVTEDGALWTRVMGDDGRLGLGGEERRWAQTLLAGAGLGGGRIGRCRGLPAEHALAFAMGTHGRLGAAADAHCSCVASEVGLIKMIFDFCLSWPRGAAGTAEGLVRLLGGGLMLDPGKTLL